MRKLVNFRLPLFIALSLIAGIVCAFNYRIQNSFSTWVIFGLFSLSILLFLFYGVINKLLIKSLTFTLIFILIFSLGSLFVTKQVDDYRDADLNFHYYTIEGRVTSIYDNGYYSYIVIENADISGNISTKLDYKIGVSVSGEILEKLDLGSTVRFFALLEDRDIIYNSRPNLYGIADNIKYSASVRVEDITIVGQNPNIFHSVHMFIRDNLKGGLDVEEFSVAYALMLGQDDYMDSELLSQFRSAGIAHIFAVSGLHIGFLAGLCIFIFKKTKLNDWIALLLTAFVLISYSGVCGFSSSSIRATIMCITLMLCNNLGLKYDGLSSVSISAIIILLISPIQLFTAGFALSFGTVLGIITLSPIFNRIFKFLPYKLSSLISSIISAQLVSAPLCLIFFDTTSLISMLFNLAILPVISFIYILTFLGAILGGFFNIPQITLFLSNYIFKGIVYLFTKTNLSVFMVGGITLTLSVLLYYLSIVIISGFFNLKILEKIIISTALILSFFLATALENIALSNKTRLYFIGEQDTSVVMLVCKEENLLIVNEFSSQSLLYRIKVVLNEEKISKIDAIIISNISNGTDVHNVVTKIHSLADFDRVYYYGEEQPSQEIAVKLSFGKDKVVENFLEGESIPTNVAKCSFVQKGYGVDISNSYFRALSLGKLPGQPNLAHSNEKFHFIIAYNYEQTVFSLYKTDNELTYFNNDGYKDAHSKGYLRYLFG